MCRGPKLSTLLRTRVGLSHQDQTDDLRPLTTPYSLKKRIHDSSYQAHYLNSHNTTCQATIPSQFTLQCFHIISHYSTTGFLHSHLLHGHISQAIVCPINVQIQSAHLFSTILLNNFSSPSAQKKKEATRASSPPSPFIY